MVGDRWSEASRGSFVRAPAGMPHDFANRTDRRVGFLNVSVPGGFEHSMPGIVRRLAEDRA